MRFENNFVIIFYTDWRYMLMLLNLFNTVFTQASTFNGRFGHHHFGYGGGIFMMILWVVIIIGAIWLIKEVVSDKNDDRRYYQEQDERYRRDSYKDKEPPEEIARKRLAKGEITREEYEEIIETLKKK